MSICMRPAIATHHLTDGRTYAQCEGCAQVSPVGEHDDGPWSQAHRGEAVAANREIDREAS